MTTTPYRESVPLWDLIRSNSGVAQCIPAANPERAKQLACELYGGEPSEWRIVDVRG